MQRRGRKPKRREQTIKAMKDDIAQKRLTPTELKDMKGKELAHRYEVSRTTATGARKDLFRDCEPARN
jgi:hypothetical protein